MKLSVEQVIDYAYSALERANDELGDYNNNSNSERKLAGLYNAITIERSITWILQNLRNLVDDFDAWYDPHKKEMEADPLMKFMVRTRNLIEKRGDAGGMIDMMELKEIEEVIEQ